MKDLLAILSLRYDNFFIEDKQESGFYKPLTTNQQFFNLLLSSFICYRCTDKSFHPPEARLVLPANRGKPVQVHALFANIHYHKKTLVHELPCHRFNTAY